MAQDGMALINDLWRQLEMLDRHRTAKRAKCQYLSDPQRYVVGLLNTEYVVNLSDRNIFSGKTGSPAPAAWLAAKQVAGAKFLEQLCLLAYLINAQELPVANKIVAAESLPGGQFFFRGPHTLPIEKLKESFGQCPERLYQVAEQFDAERCEFGDASIRLYVLPRLPLTIVIWRRCEEFDARASILFDRTAAAQLPLDALLAAVNLAVEALVKAAARSN